MFSITHISRPAGYVMETFVRPFKEGPLEDSSAAYLLKGRLLIKNDSRPDRIETASTTRIGDGYSFPGNYTLEFLEDSIYKCVTPLGYDLYEKYRVREHHLKKGENVTHTEEEYIAVILGKLSLGSRTVSEDKVAFTSEGVFTLTALEDSVYCTIGKRS